MANRTMLYVVLGAAGVGAYMYYQNQQRYEVAKAIAPVAIPKPSLLEMVLGSAASYFEKARLLDQEIKARGTAHYAAWKAAIKAKKPYYDVGGTHYDTLTGTVSAAQLEGW